MPQTPAARRWSRLIAQYETSGLTIRAFALQAGVNPSTFSWWKSRLNRRRAQVVEAPDFVELTLQPRPMAQPIRINIHRIGASIDVHHDADLNRLRHILEALC